MTQRLHWDVKRILMHEIISTVCKPIPYRFSCDLPENLSQNLPAVGQLATGCICVFHFVLSYCR